MAPSSSTTSTHPRRVIFEDSDDDSVPPQQAPNKKPANQKVDKRRRQRRAIEDDSEDESKAGPPNSAAAAAPSPTVEEDKNDYSEFDICGITGVDQYSPDPTSDYCPMVGKCGHSFCRTNLDSWFASRKGMNHHSKKGYINCVIGCKSLKKNELGVPIRVEMPSFQPTKLVPNDSLCKAISAIRAVQEQLKLASSRQERKQILEEAEADISFTKCSECKHVFSTKAKTQQNDQHHPRAPIVGQCGHSFCASCIYDNFANFLQQTNSRTRKRFPCRACVSDKPLTKQVMNFHCEHFAENIGFRDALRYWNALKKRRGDLKEKKSLPTVPANAASRPSAASLRKAARVPVVTKPTSNTNDKDQEDPNSASQLAAAADAVAEATTDSEELQPDSTEQIEQADVAKTAPAATAAPTTTQGDDDSSPIRGFIKQEFPCSFWRLQPATDCRPIKKEPGQGEKDEDPSDGFWPVAVRIEGVIDLCDESDEEEEDDEGGETTGYYPVRVKAEPQLDDAPTGGMIDHSVRVKIEDGMDVQGESVATAASEPGESEAEGSVTQATAGTEETPPAERPRTGGDNQAVDDQQQHGRLDYKSLDEYKRNQQGPIFENVAITDLTTNDNNDRDENWLKKSNNPAKIPVTAFELFSRAIHSKLTEENPGTAYGESSKIIGAMYKTLSAEERAKWDDKAKAEKQRYEAELVEYSAPAEEGDGGKQKAAKKQKDPNAPQKPRTPFGLFRNEYGPRMAKDNPGASSDEIAIMASKAWEDLGPEEKKKYKDTAKKDKERYTKEMKRYTTPLQTDKPEEGKKKDPNAPKRPMTAFMLFSDENRSKVKADNPGISFTKLNKKMGYLFKQLSDEERAYYDDLRIKDKERYKKEMAAYAAEGKSNDAVPKPTSTEDNNPPSNQKESHKQQQSVFDYSNLDEYERKLQPSTVKKDDTGVTDLTIDDGDDDGANDKEGVEEPPKAVHNNRAKGNSDDPIALDDSDDEEVEDPTVDACEENIGVKEAYKAPETTHYDQRSSSWKEDPKAQEKLSGEYGIGSRQSIVVVESRLYKKTGLFASKPIRPPSSARKNGGVIQEPGEDLDTKLKKKAVKRQLQFICKNEFEEPIRWNILDDEEEWVVPDAYVRKLLGVSAYEDMIHFSKPAHFVALRYSREGEWVADTWAARERVLEDNFARSIFKEEFLQSIKSDSNSDCFHLIDEWCRLGPGPNRRQVPHHTHQKFPPPTIHFQYPKDRRECKLAYSFASALYACGYQREAQKLHQKGAKLVSDYTQCEQMGRLVAANVPDHVLRKLETNIKTEGTFMEAIETIMNATQKNELMVVRPDLASAPATSFLVIWRGFIFDSEFKKGLQLLKHNLDICCGGDGEFRGIKEAWVMVHQALPPKQAVKPKPQGHSRKRAWSNGGGDGTRSQKRARPHANHHRYPNSFAAARGEPSGAYTGRRQGNNNKPPSRPHQPNKQQYNSSGHGGRRRPRDFDRPNNHYR